MKETIQIIISILSFIPPLIPILASIFFLIISWRIMKAIERIAQQHAKDNK